MGQCREWEALHDPRGRDDGGGRTTRVVSELARPHQHPNCRNAGSHVQLRNHDGPSTGMGTFATVALAKPDGQANR